MTWDGTIGLSEAVSGIAASGTATCPGSAEMIPVALLMSPYPGNPAGSLGPWTSVQGFVGEGIQVSGVPVHAAQSYGDWRYWLRAGIGCGGTLLTPGNHWDVEVINDQVLTWHSFAHKCAEDGSLAEAVVRSFDPIETVAAIYVHKEETETTVWVFVNGNEYDDAVMDRLLGEEQRLLSRFPDEVVSFVYIPTAGRLQRRDVVGADAQLVFQR